MALSGALSGIFVVIANAWMNTPTGFTMLDGRPTGIDPIAAIFNPAALTQTIHMTLAAYAATGFAVAGIHAFLLLRKPANAFHRRALHIALLVGGPAALLQPLSGDRSAKMVAQHQPAKLAAMEAHFRTESAAPLDHRWHSRRGDRPDALRDPDSLPALGARARRSAGGGDRPRSRAARRVAERPPGSSLVPADGRSRHLHDGHHGVGGLARLAPAGTSPSIAASCGPWRSPPRWDSWRSRRDGW